MMMVPSSALSSQPFKWVGLKSLEMARGMKLVKYCYNQERESIIIIISGASANSKGRPCW